MHLKYLNYLGKAIKSWISWYTHNPLGPPEHAQLIITNMCNSRCKHCNIWKKYRDNPELLKNELTTKEVFRLIDELKDLDVSTMSISGGEPLLRKDLFQIIEKIKNDTNIQLNITTNGILLNENTSRKLVGLGLDSINISLDGTEEIHDRIRGLKIFSKIISNIEKIEQIKKELDYNRPIINISSVITSYTYSIVKLYDFLKKHFDVNHGFGSLISTGEIYNLDKSTSIKNINTLKPTDEDLYRFIKELKKRNFNEKYLKYFELMRKYNIGAFRFPSFFHPCLAGLFNIVITEIGNVLPCCTWYDGGVVNNIRNNSLRQIWYSKDFRMKRKMIFHGKCPSCWIGTYAATSTNILPSQILNMIKIKLVGKLQ